jgi:23S rRNA (uracil-5-)-methyltransferase RumA
MDPEVVDCPVADACGGCALIDRAYDEQLRLKTQRVREALDREAALGPVVVADCLPAPRRTGYRNRAKLAVASQDGHVVAGLYRSGSNRIVDLEPCRVQGPASLATVARIKNWLGRHGLATPDGPVKYVDVREAVDDRRHLTLVLDRAEDAAPELPLEELAQSAPELVGISINHNPSRSSYVFGPRTRTPLGARGFEVDVSGLRFEVPAAGFFQVNTGPLAEVYRRMARHLGTSGLLYDLYCGVGVHGVTVRKLLRRDRDEHVGVEESAAAAACARRNAHRAAIPARFVTGKVEATFPALLESEPAFRVILNPGRPGCRPVVLEALAAARAQRVAYLSCNPETLARDLGLLVRGGFTIDEVLPVDLMPQTDHVEALALLRRDLREGLRSVGDGVADHD